MKKTILAIVAALTLATSACGSAGAGAPSATKATASAETSTQTPTPTYSPRISDFTLAVKITRQACFDTAGCNVSFKVDLSSASAAVPATGTFEVTYEVTGAKDPIIDTVTITDGQYNQTTESTRTAKAGTKLTAKITDLSYTP